MSQIDQAFIKAYRQHSSAQPADAARVTTGSAAAPQHSATATLRSGTRIRADVPQSHATRVPTPHLQLALAKAAWIAGRTSPSRAAPDNTAAPEAEQPTAEPTTAPPARKKITFSSPSLWSPTSRLGQRQRPAEPAQAAAPLPQPVGIRPPAHNRFISIEETLLRLDGPAASAQDVSAEPDNTLKIVGQLREVEIESPVEAATEAAKTPAVEVDEAPRAPVVDDEPMAVIEVPIERPVELAEAPSEVTTAACVLPVAEEVAEVTDEPAPIAPAPFQAVWEVDCFQWPEVTDRLQQDAAEEIAAACQTLAAQVTPESNLLAVTGVDEDAGATTLTLALARGLAQQGLHVAIVDADFDRPMLAERLGVRVQDGWEAALNGKLPLEEVCITSLGDQVTLVPLTAGTDMSAIKASLIAASVVKRLASVFDMVLIDAGSGSENVAAVSTSSDGVLDVAVLLAVDKRRENHSDTSDMIGRLKQCALGSIQIANTFVSA